ncbi:MAG: gamma-glutamyl-phosphate reductase, partial [Deltaproteobacteria bacterium]|nr:gamma-glutamyl-phosphate reductase [Deltaproteobacteria bacterium]
MTFKKEMLTLAREAREASQIVANLSTATKNAALVAMAEALLAAAPQLKKANTLDVRAAKKSGLSSAMIERLTLTDKGLQTMAESLREVSRLPDPVGEVGKLR